VSGDLPPCTTTVASNPFPCRTATVNTTPPGIAWADAPQTGFRAYLKTATTPPAGVYPLSAGGVIRVPPVWIVNGGAAGTPDSIAIAYGDASLGNWTDANLTTVIPAANPATTNVTVGYDTAAAPKVLDALKFRGITAAPFTDFIVIMDPGLTPNVINNSLDHGCTLYQMSAALTLTSPNTTLPKGAATLGNNTWNSAADVANWVPGNGYTTTDGVRLIGTLRWYRFWIDTAANPPNLMMTDLSAGDSTQVLAEGIEDMQIAYGCDLNGNGRIEDNINRATGATPDRANDEWFLNTTATETSITVGNNCNQPDAIRITIMARSTTTDTALSTLTGNAKPVAEDQVDMTAPAADQFRHRMISTTVFLRNWGFW
jgi:hypothetical protein